MGHDGRHFRPLGTRATMRCSPHSLLFAPRIAMRMRFRTLVTSVRSPSPRDFQRARSAAAREKENARRQARTVDGRRGRYGGDRAPDRAQGALDRAGGDGRPRLEHRARSREPVHVLRRPRDGRHHEDHGQRRRHSRRSSSTRPSPRSAPSPSRRRTRRRSGSARARRTTATARSWGAGVYLSTDARRDLDQVGLEKTKAIARIVVASDRSEDGVGGGGGRPVAAGGERGIYKTTDGGKTWKAVLSGARALRRPRGLRRSRASIRAIRTRSTRRSTRAAASPGRSRTAPAATDGKDLGGIFKHPDGGATWTKLASGLPDQDRPHRPRRLREESRRSSTRSCRATRAAPRDIDDPYSKAGGVFRSDDARRNLDAAEPARSAPVLLQPDPRRSRERQARVRARLHAPRLRRRRQDVPRGPLQEGASRQPRARHRSARAQAHCCSAPTADCTRATTAREGWEHLNRFAAGEFYRINVDNRAPVPDLRRPAGQHELGRPEPHPHQGRDSQRRLDRDRRRRWLLLRVRSDGFESRLRRVAAGRRVPLRSHERAGQESPPAARGGSAGLPLPLELAAHRERARQGRALSRRQSRLQAHQSWRAVARDLARPLVEELRPA